MDLNIDNYSTDDLLSIFNINDKNTSIIELEKYLSKSISIITCQDNEELPEDKETLIDFYTKAAFKLLNNKNIINNNILKNSQEKQEIVVDNENRTNNNFLDENQKIIERNLVNGGVRQPIPQVYTINTNKNNFSEGVVDPLERETITSLLSINSKFRDNYSKSSTDFNVDLNDPFNNVVSIKLASIEIMNSYYAVSDYLRTNQFCVDFFQYDNATNVISTIGAHKELFTIPDGNYDVNSLVDTLNDICFQNNAPLSQASSIPYYRVIEAYYDPIKGKIGFILNDAQGNTNNIANHSWGFNLDFRDSRLPNRAPFLNFGWMLGYRQLEYFFFPQTPLQPDDCCDKSYNKFKYKSHCKGDFFDYKKNSNCNKEYNNQKYKSACSDGYSPYYQDASTNILNVGFNPEAVANLIGTHYFLLEIDDFNKNQSAVFRSNTEINKNNTDTFSYNVSNVLARIPNSADFYSIIFEDSSDKVFKTRKYFGPVRISKLKIRLLDENGVVVNLNNNDIIINLQIESLNAPYKNLTYRK